MRTLVRLVPDVGERLIGMAAAVEEMLRMLAVREVDRRAPLQLPAPLANSVALDAFVRVADALMTTQTHVGDLGHLHRPAEARGTGRWVSADRERDLVPLRRVRIDEGDLEVLQRAARVLGQVVVSGSDAALVTALHGISCVVGVAPHDGAHALVVMLAKITGVLDLVPSDDGDLLFRYVDAAPMGGDVVVPPPAEASHRRELARITSLLCA